MISKIILKAGFVKYSAALLLAIGFLFPADSFAGHGFNFNPNDHSNCGGHGQEVCYFPILPSCDTNNAQVGNKCWNANPNLDSSCGGANQSICTSPISPSCDSGILERLGSGICVHPNPNNSANSGCGGHNQNICLFPTVPTCDTNMVQVGSKCFSGNPNENSNCGGANQPICQLPIFPTCDSGILERLGSGICVHPDPNNSANSSCGDHGQDICLFPTVPTCDTNMVQVGTKCFNGNPNENSNCGGANQPICQLPIFPTCDTGILERLGSGICVHPDPNNSANSSCGGHDQGICLFPTVPTCDTNMVQVGTKCFNGNPNGNSNCGGANQPICELPIFPTCDSGMAQRLETGTCHDPNPNASSNSTCGGHDQVICSLPIFPTCDTNNAQVGTKCFNADPNLDSSCGGVNQSICELPIFPTCDSGMAQRLETGTCHDPNPNAVANNDCGADKQPICTLPIFPTCDSGMAQRLETGTCHNPDPNAVANNDCGGNFQSICLLPIFPTCDTSNIEKEGSCFTPTACGGDGQRACCGITGEQQWPDNPNLLSAGCSGTPGGGTSNLIEIAGDVPHPAVCGGDNPLAFSSNGRCAPCGSLGGGICRGANVAAHERCLPGLGDDGFGFCTRCGSEGERVCAATLEGGVEAQMMCAPGLHPDFGICVADATIVEPDCDCEPKFPVGDPSQPVRGYADLHLHLFSNLAFGGLTVWGDAFDKNLGISGALRADNYAQRTADNIINGHVKQGINGDVVPIDLFRAQQLVHGDNHFNDIVGFGTGQNNSILPAPSLPNGGVEWADPDGPHFVGWPRWNSTTHQQAYYTWLQRAHRGGLQLAVMMAVNNEAMCISGRYMDYPEFACNDGMKSIDLQIAKAFELEEWLDEQCAEAQTVGSKRRIERSCATTLSSEGWFKVVLSPTEAREAIARGQLAVVIGIEEANVFDMAKSNCASNDFQCNVDYLESQLDKYYADGVRHVFPIHNFDNPYGASATWMDTIAVGNRYVNSAWFETENCPATAGEVTGVDGAGDGYGFKLAPGITDWLAGLILDVTGPFLDTPAYYPDLTTSCNKNGLTPLGNEMITMMMKKGMIIDIDHMSIKSFDHTIALAQGSEYAGIVASHALMFDLTKKEYRHERMRTAQQLREIAALGGMIGAMTQPSEGPDPGAGMPVTILQKPGSSVDNDCQASSKTFAHAYEWAVDVMTVDGKKTPVAFGSDFNGISRHNAPRFGTEACDKQQSSNLFQNSRVKYPFTIPGFGSFNKQETGGRKFDYNNDGLAHVGMLPDMIEDLKKVGLTNKDLEPLFESAEGYIAMWENSLKVGCDLDEEHGGIGQPICEAPISTACNIGLVVNLAGDSCEEPPPLAGDFNVDDCIDRSDLEILLADLNDGNSANDDPIHDLDGDGQVTALDTQELVLLYTNPRGTACGPRQARESTNNFGEKQLR